MKILQTLLLTCLICPWALAQRPPVVRCIVPTAHFPPFIYGEGERLREALPGLTVEGIRFLLGKVPNTKIEIVRIPYPRMARSMSIGEYDCTVSVDIQSVSKTGVVEHFHKVPLKKNGEIDTSKNFSVSKMSIFYNKKNPVIWDGKRLKPNILVHSPIKEFNPAGEAKGLRLITENPDILRQLKQLKMGRIEAMFSLDSLTEPLIELEHVANIEKNKIPVVETYNYLVFSKQFYEKYPEYCEEVWKHSPDFRASKEFKKIESRYYQNKKGPS